MYKLMALFLFLTVIANTADKKLIFDTEPKDISVNQKLEKVVVKIVDSLTNVLDATASNKITLALRSVDGTVQLGGTTTVTAVNGIATFENITIPTSYQGGRLVAYVAPTVLSNWDGSGASIQYGDVWPVALHGKHYAFLAHYANHGLQILDITDSANPVAVLATNWQPTKEVIDVKIHNGYAYLINDNNNFDNGIDIYSLADANPANWSHVASINTTTNGTTKKQVHNVYLEGNYLYAGNNKTGATDLGVMVYDISNPATPAFVKYIHCNGRVHDITVKENLHGKRILFASINDTDAERNGGALSIYDITTITAPATLSVSLTGPSHHSSWFKTIGGKDYISLVREPWVTGSYPEAIGDMQIWDVSDLAAPIKVKTITHGDLYLGNDLHAVHNPTFDATEDLLYVAWYQAGAYLFDVKDPVNPKLLGFHDTQPAKVVWTGCWSVYPFLGRNKVVAVDMVNGVFILDFTDTVLEAAFSTSFNVGTMVAVDDSAITAEDTPVIINLTGNDTGAGLTVFSVTSTANGSVVNNNNGTITFSPTLNFNGTLALNYTLKDSNFGADYGAIAITVTAVNDKPVAVNDTVSVTESTATDINVMSNDSDADGDSISVSAFTQGAHGTVVTSGSSLKYTPVQFYTGSDSFTYTVTDSLLTATATVSVTVTASLVNNANVVLSESSSSVTEGGVKEFTVVLASKPQNDVNLLIAKSNAEITLSTSALVFTTNNWDQPQKITVTSIGNISLEDKSSVVTVAINVATSDSKYAGVGAKSFTLTIKHGDTAGIAVDKSALIFSNVNGSGEFSVSLSNQPASDVTLGVSVDNISEIVLNKTSLVFTSSNWNTAQKVTVTPIAIYDGLYKGVVTVKVLTGTFSASNKTVAVTLTNALPPKFKVSIIVSEGGESSLLGEVVKIQGETLDIVFKAKEHFVFKHVLVNGSIYSTKLEVKILNITTDLTVKGVFNKISLEPVDPDKKTPPSEADKSLVENTVNTVVTKDNLKEISDKVNFFSTLSLETEDLKKVVDIISGIATSVTSDMPNDVVASLLLGINNIVEPPKTDKSNVLDKETQAKILDSLGLIQNQAVLPDEAFSLGFDAISKLAEHEPESADDNKKLVKSFIDKLVQMASVPDSVVASFTQTTFKVKISTAPTNLTTTETASFGSTDDGATVKLSGGLINGKGVSRISTLSFKNLPASTFNSEMISDAVTINFFNSVGGLLEIKDLSEADAITIEIPYNIIVAKSQKKYHATSHITVYYFDEVSGKWVNDGISDLVLDESTSKATFKTKHLSEFAVFLGDVGEVSEEHDHDSHDHGDVVDPLPEPVGTSGSGGGGGCRYIASNDATVFSLLPLFLFFLFNLLRSSLVRFLRAKKF